MSPLAAYCLSLILAVFPPGKVPSIETREAGVERLRLVARAQADSAEEFGGRWPEGARDLVRASVAKFGWSMGYQLRVQTGALRGPGGEVCFADLQLPTLRQFATFETAGKSNDELARLVTGLDYASLRRCMDTGHNALVHVRRVAARRCKGYQPELAAFAFYANGRSCYSAGRQWVERNPYWSLLRFRGRTETVFPAWYSVRDDERLAEARP